MNKYFTDNKKYIEKELSAILQKQVRNSFKHYPWAEDALSRLEEFALSGKLIRGLFVLLFSQSSISKKNQGKSSDALAIATALELIHSGLLIHDDIMDRDTKRRSLETIYIQYSKLNSSNLSTERIHYGESMASCVGIISYFAAMAQFSKVTDYTKLQKLLDLFGNEMQLLGLGQMDDIDTSSIPGRASIDSIKRVYTQKTGRYTCATPMIAGFILAGTDSSDVRKTVYKMADYLGLIFQLKDDLLGVFGKTSETGKSVGGDIRERKFTWLYFDTLQFSSNADAKKLKKLYSQQRMLTTTEQKWVFNLMKSCQVQGRAEKLILHNQQLALKLMKELPLSKTQTEIFEDLINYLVTRTK